MKTKKTNYAPVVPALIILLACSLGSFAGTGGDDVKPLKFLCFSKKYPPKAILNFSVNIFFGDRSETKMNLEQGQFFLLDKDIIGILKDLKLNPTDVDGERIEGLDENEAYLEAAVRVMQSLAKNKDLRNFFEYGTEQQRSNIETDDDEDDIDNLLIGYLLEAKLQEHVIKTFELDRFLSDERFTHKAGQYFIFGFGKFGSELFIWEQSIRLNAGENTFEFDQYNAEVAADW